MQQLHTTAAAATASELEPLLRAWACSWHAYPDQPTHALYVCTAHRRMRRPVRPCMADGSWLWGSSRGPRARAHAGRASHFAGRRRRLPFEFEVPRFEVER